jgi:DNA-3-methyladenine glycosylase
LGRPLGGDFYDRPVLEVARSLIGCLLVCRGVGGVIVETEAYRGDDPACHGHGGMTPRNRALFGPGGHAYVYRSYGIHNCFNVVAEREGTAAAALVRALSPAVGLDEMRRRRGREDALELCSGPGKLGQALGIGLDDDGRGLDQPPLTIHPPAADWRNVDVVAGPRIGITKAVDLPWRFCAAGDPHVSRPHPWARRARRPGGGVRA